MLYVYSYMQYLYAILLHARVSNIVHHKYSRHLSTNLQLDKLDRILEIS